MNLYDHQDKIVKDDKPVTGIFTGTGTGKTRTALMLAHGSTLVICPKTQKEDGNWERELINLPGDIRHINKWIPKNGLATISKETFRRDHESIGRYNTLIVDEAHTCLGVTPNTRYRKKQEIPKASQLFEALDEYIERTKPDRLYLCTATLLKTPFTVWAAGKLLKNPIMQYDMQGFYNFRRDFYTRLPMPGREVWVAKSDSATKDKLAAIVRELGYVGRLQDFFDVPDQTFKTEHIELTAAQKARIKELALEYPEPIVRIGKRHQVENGVLAGDEFSPVETFSNGKIDRIVELAAEFPQMVVFAKYRAQITHIAVELRHQGYKVWEMTGDTTNRGELIAEANKSDGVFVCQAQISAGWELPEYPVMVFASCTYSFVDRQQGEGRILRANHLKKNLYIDLVVKGGIDEAVHNSLINKKDFDEHIYMNAIDISGKH